MWHAMGESVKEIMKERNKYVDGGNKNIQVLWVRQCD
jgi:hypothetical protein